MERSGPEVTLHFLPFNKHGSAGADYWQAMPMLFSSIHAAKRAVGSVRGAGPRTDEDEADATPSIVIIADSEEVSEHKRSCSEKSPFSKVPFQQGSRQKRSRCG